jgi:hypothetical protein
MPRIYELPDQPGSWTGNGWDHLPLFERSRHMHMSSSYWRLYVFIEYNPFHFLISWWTILWWDSGWIPPLLWRLMVKRKIKYPVMRIVGYIKISCSTLFNGRVMIPLHGNQRSWLVGYKRIRSIINGMPENLDHWKILLEDFEPRRVIQSWRWNGT